MTSTIEKPVEKNERTIRSFSGAYNEGTKHKQLIIEECNSAENWTPIVEAFKAGRARDISDEPKVDKVPCVIIGSGPSLDHSIKHLKQWKGGILCSTSHALTLMYHGIEPTHIVCLDPFSGWDEIKGVDWSKTRTKLVLHPGITPEMVATWPGEMLLYIQDNGHPDSFYETTQKRMYTWRDGPPRNPTFHFYIRTKITIFACSPPMQMFVADRLGYGTVFLCGCDYGFPHNKERFTGYTVGDDGKWITHEHPYTPADGKVMTNSGVLTAEMHLYYKKNHISAWRLSHQQMYSTDQGIMCEVPFTNVEKMIQKQGLNYPTQSHEMIERITERYLASVGAFVVVTDNGVAFIESENPLQDLPAFMAGIERQYKCDKCSAQSLANDEKDHTGEACPECKDGKILRSVGIDVAGNMARVEKLLALVKARQAVK
jgi:DNA-directed RNA polymerase subunit RPC12/RpoP